MSVNRLLLAAGFLTLLAAAPAGAAVSAAPGETQRYDGGTTFQEIIETRCTICHTRERVDAAIRSHAELEALLRRMIERGAIISERDHKVLGTFWGSPLKGEGQPAAPR
jgi:cytochrome c553